MVALGLAVGRGLCSLCRHGTAKRRRGSCEAGGWRLSVAAGKVVCRRRAATPGGGWDEPVATEG